MTEYQTAPFVEVGFVREDLYISFGTKRVKIVRPEVQNAVLDCLLEAKSPLSLNNLKSKILLKGHEESVADEVINLLVGKFIQESDEYTESSQTSAFFGLSTPHPAKAIKKLSSSSVCIIGCGGIGTTIATSLAASGIKNLTLVDEGSVQQSDIETNLLWSLDSIGKEKSKEAAYLISSRHPSITIKTLKTPSEEVIASQNIVVHCTEDDPWECIKWNRICVEQNTAFFRVSCVEDILCWGPLVIPGRTGCYSCQNHNVEHLLTQNDPMRLKCEKINQSFQHPGHISTNTSVGSLATMDIIRFLAEFETPLTLNKRLALWTDNVNLEIQTYERNPSCPVCSNVPKAKTPTRLQEARKCLVSV